MSQFWAELRAAITKLNYLQNLVFEQRRQIASLEQQLRDARSI